MSERIERSGIDIFSTSPPLAAADGASYLRRVIEIARWSDEAGCRGILVYTDNRQMDPWLVAQVIIQNTRALCPLVAVQPLYMHPYTVAKMVTTLGKLHGLRLDPPLAPALAPGYFVSGSSEAGLAAARAIGAVAVRYPGPERGDAA